MQLKGEALVSDGVSGRWTKGEVGNVVEHNFEKYHYCIKFDSVAINGRTYDRTFFFHEHEIYLLPENDNGKDEERLQS